jgi:hypothetical protein
MSSKSLGRKLKGIKNGIGSILRKHMLCRSNSHVALDVTPIEPIQQGQWATLPPELLLDIIRRVRHLGLCVLLLSFVFRYVNHGGRSLKRLLRQLSNVEGSHFLFH